MSFLNTYITAIKKKITVSFLYSFNDLQRLKIDEEKNGILLYITVFFFNTKNNH